MGWNCPSEEASAAPLPLDDVSLGIFLLSEAEISECLDFVAVGIAPLRRTLCWRTATSLRLFNQARGLIVSALSGWIEFC